MPLTLNLADLCPITVATNAEFVVQRSRLQEGVKLLLLGGEYEDWAKAYFRELTEVSISRSRVDRLIMSVSTIADGYCYHPQRNVARTKRQMIVATRQRILAADCSKFSRAALYKIGFLADSGIVTTDTQTPSEIVADMRKSGLQMDVVQRFAVVGCVCPSWRLHEVLSPALSVNRKPCQSLVSGISRASSGVSPIARRDAARLVWNYLIRAKE